MNAQGSTFLREGLGTRLSYSIRLTLAELSQSH